MVMFEYDKPNYQNVMRGMVFEIDSCLYHTLGVIWKLFFHISFRVAKDNIEMYDVHDLYDMSTYV